MEPPTQSLEAVLKSSSSDYCANLDRARGYTFEDESGQLELDYKKLFESFKYTGCQATHMGAAVDIVNQMLADKSIPYFTDESIDDEFIRPKTRCTIFLAYTSNMISSGIRENIRFLVKNKLIDCIVTTAGAIEEDLIKCLKETPEKHCDTYVGTFKLSGSTLRENGINRIGNLLVPNINYCRFEDWLIPILDKMLAEQKEAKGNLVWSPSKFIERLGLEINHKDSVCYWAARNKIPIFCPAIIDGSLGDMLFFHSYKSPGLIIDLVSDIRRINTFAHYTSSYKTGVIILGGGVCKHHTMNANLMRNGADYSVFINTANEFDGSDSGAEPDEAVSWGKLRPQAKSIKLVCDATIAFPLLVAQTFYNYASKRWRSVADVNAYA